MAFKLKNPLKTPLKQNNPQEQFGPQLSDNIDPRDLLAPPAPQYNTVFPKFDDEGYSVGNVDGKRIIRFNTYNKHEIKIADIGILKCIFSFGIKTVINISNKLK